MLRRAAVLGTLVLIGCGGEGDLSDELSELSAAVAGPWSIPRAILSIGDRQDVAYTSGGPWVGSSGCTSGLTRGAAELRDFLYETYSQTHHIGGYNCRPINGDASRMSIHATGRALDVHIRTRSGNADNGLGDPIGNWLIENAEYIGIQYIIWDRWTWRADRADGDKDRSYTGAHPHHDHLHVELSVAGGDRRTDFFHPGPFRDVPPSSPYATAIAWLAEEGITVGCNPAGTLFCPRARVTREQTATFIARAFSLPATATDYFIDDNSSQHEGAIDRIAAAGITSGCAPRRFCPAADVLRGEMAAFLARALSLPATNVDHFDDDDGTTFESAINRIAQAGITSGCGGRRFCPDDAVTREQMATFLYRALH